MKHIFSPNEAEIATCLTYKLEPIEIVFERAAHLIESPEKLTEILGGIEKKGGVELEIKNGKRFYRNVPLVVGMRANPFTQINRLYPRQARQEEAYLLRFGFDMHGSKEMRIGYTE